MPPLFGLVLHGNIKFRSKRFLTQGLLQMKLYLSGPMRCIPHYNFPAFAEAKAILAAKGIEVLSPADMELEEGLDPFSFPADWDWCTVPGEFDMDDACRRDVDAIITCDGVCLMEGWRASKGATAEATLAIWLGKEVYEMDGETLQLITHFDCSPAYAFQDTTLA